MRKITFSYIMAVILEHNIWLSKYISDELYIKILFKGYMGEKLNLRSPSSFNEKLQWIKLYDHNPLYTKMVDKYVVKDYVRRTIGVDYIIPTIGIWDDFKQINFDKLPDQFVLKCTHDSGGVVICYEKNKLNIKKTKRFFDKALTKNFYYIGREWPYKNIKPRILAEKYMKDVNNNLKDYKFFCFNGVPKIMFIASDRQMKGEETKFDFYDMDFKHLPFTNGHPNSSCCLTKPQTFEKMKQLAAKLSEGIPHVRVDFYDIDGKIYFGELTFFHWSGFVPFKPDEFDKKMGEWIMLPDSVTI